MNLPWTIVDPTEKLHRFTIIGSLALMLNLIGSKSRFKPYRHHFNGHFIELIRLGVTLLVLISTSHVRTLEDTNILIASACLKVDAMNDEDKTEEKPTMTIFPLFILP